MTTSARQKAPPSLFSQLVLTYAFVAVVALVLGAVVLHRTLNVVVWDEHRRGILASADGIIQRLSREGVAGLNSPLRPEEDRRFDASTGSMRYAVLGGAGGVLALSPGAAPALPRIVEGGIPASFTEGQDGSRVWGVTQRVATPNGPVHIQIAQDMERAYVVLDDVPPAALRPVLLVLAGGAAVLFGANALLLLVTLRPLRQAAAEAARIGEGGPRRLGETDLPPEVQPLIRAVNGALDRLDEALEWHRGFSAEVAHELRTPLAMILAELDLMEEGETRDRLRDDVQGLARMVSDLLEAAEAARDRPAGAEAFDLVELATDTARRLSPLAAQEGHRIVAPAGHPPVWVRGDRASVGRAVRNLVENAIAHSPMGQPVELRLAAAPAGEARLEVADHGRGVPAMERTKVFRRSWRAGDTHRRGLGLGLSIVDRIARAHGGRVTVGDNPGGGAVFTLCLPEAEEETVSPPSPRGR